MARGLRLGVAVGTLIAAAALAACGGADDPGGGAAATLRLGYFPNITHAPALVGVERKIFQQHLGDAKLETTTFNAGPSAIEALFSGAIDATYIGPNPAINGWAQSKGEALRIIAGTTSGGAGLVVRPGTTSVPDLRGKVVATPQLGNTQDVAARHWLTQQGFRFDTAGGGDLEVKPIPNAEIITGFAAGSIDAAWLPEPHLSRLVLEHGGKVLIDEKELWPGGAFVTTHLIVSASFLDREPDLVRRLLAGHLEAITFTNNNPDEAQRSANAQLAALTGKALPDNVITAAFDNLTFTTDPIASSLALSAQHAQAVGLLKPVDLKGIYALEPLNAVLQAAGQPAVSAGGLES